MKMVDALEMFRVEFCDGGFIGTLTCYYHRFTDMPILTGIFGLLFSICANIVFKLSHDTNLLTKYFYSTLVALFVTAAFYIYFSTHLSLYYDEEFISKYSYKILMMYLTLSCFFATIFVYVSKGYLVTAALSLYSGLTIYHSLSVNYSLLDYFNDWNIFLLVGIIIFFIYTETKQFINDFLGLY